MPRKTYTPRNPFIHNTNLPIHAFMTLSQGFVVGISGAEMHRLMTKGHEETGDVPRPPSVKTINKLYKRLGHYLFERLVEPRLPPIGQMKELFPAKHEEYLDHMAKLLTDFALSGMEYDIWRQVKEDSPIFAIDELMSDEVRSIYAARKGHSSDPRAVVGLATFRLMGRRQFGNLAGEELLLTLQEVLLDYLRHDPLRLS